MCKYWELLCKYKSLFLLLQWIKFADVLPSTQRWQLTWNTGWSRAIIRSQQPGGVNEYQGAIGNLKFLRHPLHYASFNNFIERKVFYYRISNKAWWEKQNTTTANSGWVIYILKITRKQINEWSNHRWLLSILLCLFVVLFCFFFFLFIYINICIFSPSFFFFPYFTINNSLNRRSYEIEVGYAQHSLKIKLLKDRESRVVGSLLAVL